MSIPYRYEYWRGPTSKYFDSFHHYRSNQPISYWTAKQRTESRLHMAKAKKFIMKNPFVHQGARIFQNKFRKYIAKKKDDENRMKQIGLHTKWKAEKLEKARKAR